MVSKLNGKFAISFSVLFLFFASSCRAADGTVSVSWLSESGEVLAERRLGLADFDSLNQMEIRTKTPWTSQISTFSGALIADVGRFQRYEVISVAVEALNDYSAVIEGEDIKKYNIILASREDGKLMKVRDKGPYWIMYPLDQNPEINNQYTFSKMVWQVNKIEFTVKTQ